MPDIDLRERLKALCVALRYSAAPYQSQTILTIMENIQLTVNATDGVALSQALSIEESEGKDEGRNGFYWLMIALNRAASKNSSEHVKAISALAANIVEKCAAQLAVGLSASVTVGADAGANGFYILMAALHCAVFNNSSENAKVISTLAVEVVKKCDAAQLAAGLSSVAQAGKHSGKNGFYWLLYAIKKMLKSPEIFVDEKIKSTYHFLFELLGKIKKDAIDSNTKQSIVDLKRDLKEALKAYLAQASTQNNFAAICDANTMLGALIDHHRIIQSDNPTSTRDHVTELLKKQTTEYASTPAAAAVVAVLDNRSSDSSTPEKEVEGNLSELLEKVVASIPNSPPPSYDELKNRAKQAVLQAAVALRDKLLRRNNKDWSSERVAFNDAKAEAKKWGYDVDQDSNQYIKNCLATIKTEIASRLIVSGPTLFAPSQEQVMHRAALEAAAKKQADEAAAKETESVKALMDGLFPPISKPPTESKIPERSTTPETDTPTKKRGGPLPS